MRKRILAGAIPMAIAAATLIVFTLGSQSTAAPMPAGDKYPNGCVSCHVKSGAKDLRLNSVLGKVKNHPNVAAMMKTVPTSCGMCHKKGPKPPKLMDAIHKIHGKQFKIAAAAFGQKPAGACLNCHSADGKVKSGAKNW